MKSFSLRYTLLTYRLDQLWFPLAFWALFVILALFMLGSDQFMNFVRTYIGVVVPLIGGVMAASALLDDPAIELRFSTPVSAARTMIERLGLTLLIQTATALSFQVFIGVIGGDFSMYHSAWHLQLAWLLPTLALMSLGCMAALAAAQPMIGSLLVGLTWIIQLIIRGWMAGNNGKYILLFMGSLMPDHPDLPANHLVLAAISQFFFLVSWHLLLHQERYIQ
jgi:hypothetical protein